MFSKNLQNLDINALNKFESYTIIHICSCKYMPYVYIHKVSVGKNDMVFIFIHLPWLLLLWDILLYYSSL